MHTRMESDSFGPIAVPAKACWGAQTQRSIANFPFPKSETMPPAIIHALAGIKIAAARVNTLHGLDPRKAQAIETAALAVAAGVHDDQFPLTIWQTGSGTQTNMNVNEVVAGLANEALTGQRGGKAPVHPNDDVNRGQSSNDSFPTAVHIACARAIRDRLLPALDQLEAAFAERARSFAPIVKIGRTHLQDAVPLGLGDECSAQAAMLVLARLPFAGAMDRLCAIAQGGTAVGTGLNAPPGFARDMARELASLTGLPLRPAENPFAALAGRGALVEASAACEGLAIALTKIANDVRLLASGPRAGLNELQLPENEPGSSIMPGKVNPTQCEMVTMVAAQVIGNHAAIGIGAMQGHLQLNAFSPMIGAALLRSIDLLAIAMTSFAERCVAGLRANEGRIGELVDQSLMLVTALAPEIGYDRAAHIAKRAHAEGASLRVAAIAEGVDPVVYDRIVQPGALAFPHDPPKARPDHGSKPRPSGFRPDTPEFMHFKGDFR